MLQQCYILLNWNNPYTKQREINIRIFMTNHKYVETKMWDILLTVLWDSYFYSKLLLRSTKVSSKIIYISISTYIDIDIYR